MDAVRFIMKDKYKSSNLYNYIDDLVYTGLPIDIYDSYNTLIALLINQSKLVSPTSCAVCLVIEINTINCTLKIPSEKLLEIHKNLCTICYQK